MNTIPNFSEQICDDCKARIASTQSWMTAAEGLNNPREYARHVMASFCPSCKATVLRLAKEQQRKRR